MCVLYHHDDHHCTLLQRAVTYIVADDGDNDELHSFSQLQMCRLLRKEHAQLPAAKELLVSCIGISSPHLFFLLSLNYVNAVI